jgi:hypothetical protein
MDCRSARAFAALAFAFTATAGLAAPEQVRGEIASRLQARLPDFALQDYAMGAGAIDAELRARIEENAVAGSDALAAGRKLWAAKFKDGRTLAATYPVVKRLVGAPFFDAAISVPQQSDLAGRFVLDTGCLCAVTLLSPFVDQHKLLTALPQAKQAGFSAGAMFS